MSRLPLLLLLAAGIAQGAPGCRQPSADLHRLWRDEVARLAARLRTIPSDTEQAAFLRRYTGELIDIGRLDERTKQRYESVDFTSFDPAEFYPLFASDSLPANCGITSFFYIKLLQALGFKAYQYSFGFTEQPYDRFIHSVALVDVDVGGARRLIVQDPYLNLTFRSRNGQPLDVFDLLSLLRARRYDDVVMESSSLTTSLLVPDPALYYPYLTGDCRTAMSNALQRADGSLRTVLPISRSFASLMQSECGGFEQDFVAALRQHGFDEPFLYAYTLRASEVVGSPDAARVQQAIDKVLRP